ncbi:phosphatase PAP2 family protein [Azospirillum sp.]|uniref:phosphatase PAP2 family protein n=1 Tax=Azospirillum sp. TaxID=34012 RepID=UPI003D702C2B
MNATELPAVREIVGFDEALRDRLLPACGPRSVAAARVLAVLTSRYTLAPAALAAWRLGHVSGRRRVATAGRAVVAALAAEAVAATAVKMIARRRRPPRSGRPPNDRSMPSGHTANVAATATALAAATDSDVVLAAGMLLAVVTAASRVVVNRHWASDGIAGLLLGYACAKLTAPFTVERP